MKSLLVALLSLASVAAAAGPLEDSYFAARDSHIAKFSAIGAAGNLDEEDVEDHQRARDELTRLLRTIVGPVAIKGFRAPGRTNLDSLFKGDEGFGRLDGLLFASPDDKAHVVVTTDALLDRWLRAHKDWWGPNVANVPQDVDAALRSEAFYTQALMTDAAFFRYAELAVAKPTKARFAYAMLVARAQTLGPRTPDELIVSVARGGRVLVASAPANARIAPVSACAKLWRTAKERAAAAREAASIDDKRPAPSDRAEEEGDAAFRRCFAQHAKGRGYFAALTKRAQGLADRLASPAQR